eukprot:3337445-Pleurochrysis_carterae.AAC.1
MYARMCACVCLREYEKQKDAIERRRAEAQQRKMRKNEMKSAEEIMTKRRRHPADVAIWHQGKQCNKRGNAAPEK